MHKAANSAKFLAAAAAVATVWFVGLATLTVAFEPEADVNVFGREPQLLRALAGSDVRLMSSGRGFMRVRGDGPGFVWQLYAHGAWLVLPGTAGGCGIPAADLVKKTWTMRAGVL